MTVATPPFRALLTLLIASVAASCESTPRGAHELPKPAADLPAGKAGETRTVVLAAGCFWCVESVFEPLIGVTDVTSGFAGGTAETATYEQVSAGKTDHAEAVRITYDPSKITYAQLLHVYFSIFDPTTLDRQGPDAGRQYRSAFFHETDEQKRVTDAYVKQLADARTFDKPIVTAVEPLKAFYPADAHHQDYVKLHPDDPYVRQWAVPKMAKDREHFAGLLKSGSAASPAP